MLQQECLDLLLREHCSVGIRDGNQQSSYSIYYHNVIHYDIIVIFQYALCCGIYRFSHFYCWPTSWDGEHVEWMYYMYYYLCHATNMKHLKTHLNCTKGSVCKVKHSWIKWNSWNSNADRYMWLARWASIKTTFKMMVLQIKYLHRRHSCKYIWGVDKVHTLKIQTAVWTLMFQCNKKKKRDTSGQHIA